MSSEISIYIRADSSSTIGTGHVMRCLTLAGALRSAGYKVTFLCKPLPGAIISIIEAAGFSVQPIAVDAAMAADAEASAAIVSPGATVIVDSYALDSRWEEVVRRKAGRLVVIDDLANRPHACDVLLDQNLYADFETRYGGLVPEGSVQLLGPKYALLREQFLESRATLRERKGELKRVLVFFGGADSPNVTNRVLDAIEIFEDASLWYEVIVGSSNSHRESIAARCASMSRVSCEEQVTDMAVRMAKADVALGACGSATWERCCLGLPTVIVTVAAHEEQLAQVADAHGFATYLGRSEEVSAEDIVSALGGLLRGQAYLENMSAKALELVDGKGVQRVVEHIVSA